MIQVGVLLELHDTMQAAAGYSLHLCRKPTSTYNIQVQITFTCTYMAYNKGNLPLEEMKGCIKSLQG